MSVEGKLRQEVREDVAERNAGFWVVGGVMLALVTILLIGGIFFSKQLRSDTSIRPQTIESASTKSAGLPTAHPAPGGQAAIVPTTAAVTPDAKSFPSATPAAFSVATSPLEREIEAAYLRYWDVRTQAYFNLDAAGLSEVMAGAELTRAKNQIDQLRAQGRAGKLDVEHRIAFVSVSQDDAVIYDEYVNRSVFLDANSKQELHTDEPPSVEKISYVMKRIDGNWKVVDGTRHD